MKYKKIITSLLLVITGTLIGCGVSNRPVEVKASSTKYEEADLGRIKLITYIDEKNGNIVYISYDTQYADGHQLNGVGMTSEPFKK